MADDKVSELEFSGFKWTFVANVFVWNCIVTYHERDCIIYLVKLLGTLFMS